METIYINIANVNTSKIADTLPSKTVPEVGKKQTRTLKPKIKVMAAPPPKKRARAHSVEVEEVEDEDSACNIAARNNGISPASSFEIPATKKVSCVLLHFKFSIQLWFFRRALAET